MNAACREKIVARASVQDVVHTEQNPLALGFQSGYTISKSKREKDYLADRTDLHTAPGKEGYGQQFERTHESDDDGQRKQFESEQKIPRR